MRKSKGNPDPSGIIGGFGVKYGAIYSLECTNDGNPKVEVFKQEVDDRRKNTTYSLYG